MKFLKNKSIRMGLIILFLITIFLTYKIATLESVENQDALTHVFFYTSIATSIACIAFPFFCFKFLELKGFTIKISAFVIGVIGAGLVGVDQLFNLGYIYAPLKEFSDKGGLWIFNISLLIGAQILIDIDDEVTQGYEEQLKTNEETIRLNNLEIDRLSKLIKLLKSE